MTVINLTLKALGTERAVRGAELPAEKNIPSRAQVLAGEIPTPPLADQVELWGEDTSPPRTRILCIGGGHLLSTT